jgi:hypothetical protein
MYKSLTSIKQAFLKVLDADREENLPSNLSEYCKERDMMLLQSEYYAFMTGST